MHTGPAGNSDDNGQYGSFLDTSEFINAPHVLPPEALTGVTESLPSRITLDNLPPVAMQGTLQHLGSPGSCEAQSFGYCLGSYTAARNPDGSVKWDPTLPQNQISAAYLYKWEHTQQNLQCPHGSQAIPYINHLIASGSADAFMVPYYPVCCYLNDVSLNVNYPDMTRFCVGSMATLIIKDDPAAAVVMIKKLLAAGCAVAFSGLVIKNYGNPALDDGILCVTDTIPKSGHGQTVVGYDDHIGPPGNPGAFLIQNSFGPQWPSLPNTSKASPGRLYWSYETFQTQSLAATAYPYNSGPLTGIILSTTGEPKAAVNRAWQWAPEDRTGVWIIAMLQFTAPIALTQVTFIEPITGTSISGQYVQNINNGYVYFTRTDGNQFMAGDWGIQLAGQSLNGAAVTYAGIVTIPAAKPASPPAAVVKQNTPITDTTLKPAVITPSPHS